MTPAIETLQQQAEASFMPYGPPDGGVRLVETFGAYEAEYAALRKGVGLFVAAHKGVVELTGGDRRDFLHRMVTGDINRLKPGRGCRAFLLDTRGRIVADLTVLHEAERTLLEVDVFQTAEVVKTLDNYLFSEDVVLSDGRGGFTKITLHGPASAKLLEALGEGSPVGLQPYQHCGIELGGTDGVVYRRDETGSLGLHILIRSDTADALYARLADAVGGLAPDTEPGEDGRGGAKRDIPGRGVGWLAYNTARIEAQTALFHIDFGRDSLPHETGDRVLGEAVSFTKGCYLGQEIVARMQSLGHPKKLLVGLKLDDDRMPVSGVPVFDLEAESTEIGAVTSSTISPLLGGKAIALAMMKWGRHHDGTKVRVPAEGQRVEAMVTTKPVVGG